MSDLEGEETKEFIDLGFVSTKEDLNAELPEILPGHIWEHFPTGKKRVYLLEAWEFQSDKRSGRSEKDSMDIDLRMT